MQQFYFTACKRKGSGSHHIRPLEGCVKISFIFASASGNVSLPDVIPRVCKQQIDILKTLRGHDSRVHEPGRRAAARKTTTKSAMP